MAAPCSDVHNRRTLTRREMPLAAPSVHIRVRMATNDPKRTRPLNGAVEAAGHASEERERHAARAFTAFADNVRNYAIFLLDPDGIITYWGEGARLMKWWTHEQAEGAHLRLLYPDGGSDDGTAEEHVREAEERGEYTGEGHRIRSDGSTFWAGVTLTALRSGDGSLLGFAKVTRDLTARRAADELLQAAAASADAAHAEAEAASGTDAARSGLLATMSHELRTPINAVLGYLDLLELETDGPLSAGQRQHLTRARTSAKHLLALVGDVLDFSRMEADQAPLDRQRFRVGDAVSGAIELVVPQARARGVELTDAVSGYAAGLAAWGDLGRARQILVNLLANATRFTGPRHGEAGRITVSAGTAAKVSAEPGLHGSGPWVYVRVEDTGTGIPADWLQPIFEPFVQGDTGLAGAHGGAGLGLAISRRLARRMGGDVQVRSEVGVGSTFLLWLPAAPADSLQTGGVEGQGAGDDAASLSDEHTATQQAHPMRVIADVVLAELERVLFAYVARLRSDPATPSAHGVDEALIEDHLATFLGDLASTLSNLDQVGGPEGERNEALKDSTELQRHIADRHGAQRARLGWSESEIRREFTILREELTAAIRRRAPQLQDAPTAEARRLETERALEVLTQFLAVAERLSVMSHARASAARAREAE